MKKTKAPNAATSQTKPRSSSATSKKLQTELLLSLGKNENLSEMLADKDVLINNMISRAGDLEQMILEKDEYADNLAQSLNKQESYIGEQNKAITLHDQHVIHLDQHITQQGDAISQRDEHVARLDQHIAQQSDAISQRDEHVARLERKNSEAFKLLKQCLTLEASINEIDQNLSKLSNLENSIGALTSHNDEVFKSFQTKNNKLINDNLSQHVEKILDRFKQQYSQFDFYQQETHQRSEHIAQLQAQLHSQLHIYDSQRDESIVNRIVGYAHEVARLQKEIQAKDSWGAEVQNRLHQLNNELTALKSSTWWRLTAPLRASVELVFLFLRKLIKLFKLPFKLSFKLATKIGWTLTPKLFHRVYHHSFTQRVMQRQQISAITPPLDEGISTQTPSPLPPPVISVALREEQTSDNKWHLGERIDGPLQG